MFYAFVHGQSTIIGINFSRTENNFHYRWGLCEKTDGFVPLYWFSRALSMISSGNADNRFVSQPTFHQCFDFASFEFLRFNFFFGSQMDFHKSCSIFHNRCHPWFLIGLIHLGIWSYCQKLVSTKGHVMPKNKFQS